MLRGRDIERYSNNFNNTYLINTHNGLKEKNLDPINIDDYKAIKKYLDKYYEQLEKRQDKGDTLYNLRNCAYIEDFEKDRIIWTPFNGIYYFSFIEAVYYCNNSVFMITHNKNNIIELKYLLAIMSVVTYKFGNLTTPLTSVGNYTYGSKEFMQTIPIPEADDETQSDIVQLVDEIIQLKKSSKDTLLLEKKIDEVVYKLYNLNDEEIKIIEGE